MSTFVENLKLPEDKFWYFASPYSKYPSGMEDAFVDVCVFAAKAIEQGLNIFSPIAHSHPIAELGEIAKDDYTTWLKLDKAIMSNAHGIIVLLMESWEKSSGIKWEVEQFKAWGKPVVYLDPEDLI